MSFLTEGLRAATYLALRPIATSANHQGRSGIGWRVFHAVTGPLFLALALVPTAIGVAAIAVLAEWLVSWGRLDDPLHVGGLGLEAGYWMLGLGLLTVTGAALSLRFVRPLANLHARMSLVAELTQRVDLLTSTRAEALDAHGAELRRIERDLHDGTQAQLVALSMRLGLAEESVRDRPEAATLLREARTGAEEAMAGLRSVIRTMYPPILADRGLAGAVSGLAARSIIPVNLHVSDLGALPAPVEAAAYFVIAESVTNAIKHSNAIQILVSLDRSYETLHVQVTDDGVGGIDETLGTGILGIQRRVAALDGATTIHSPVGGGTTITVELPCRG